MDLKKFWGTYAGAVSLTFDDGTGSQLQKAIPMMDNVEVKGTFYLCPNGERWQEKLKPWEEVARTGHEIGNHTLSHTCSNNFNGGRGGLEDMSIGDIETDMLAAQERLAQIAPHQKEWTFCYPCYQTFVGRGRMRQSYVPVVAKYFLAGRAGGEYGFGNHPGGVDLACVWGLATDRMSGFEMVGLVEERAFQGRWVILVFHHIDEGSLSVTSRAFESLLKYLRRRSGEIWTAPVKEVARKIADFRSAKEKF